MPNQKLCGDKRAGLGVFLAYHRRIRLRLVSVQVWLVQGAWAGFIAGGGGANYDRGGGGGGSTIASHWFLSNTLEISGGNHVFVSTNYVLCLQRESGTKETSI